MKKILFALIALCVVLPSVAQDYKIIHDETNSEGHRVVFCDLVNTRSFTDKHIYNVALGALVYSTNEERGDTTKYLRIQVNAGPYKVEKGMVLLIKNVDGEVVELYANYDVDATIWETIWVGNSAVRVYGKPVAYNITDADLAKLKKGITKFRQEVVAGHHDKEYKKEKDIKKVTDVIIAHDKLLNEALATEKTFDSDF